MAAAAELRPGQTVIETACGFGGTARYLAGEHGVRVQATNIAERNSSKRATSPSGRAFPIWWTTDMPTITTCPSRIPASMSGGARKRCSIRSRSDGSSRRR